MPASDIMLKPIPLVDLKRQIEAIRPEMDAALTGIWERTDFIGGKACTEFENAFARYCQADYSIGVGNGTDALYLILRALGVGPGDEVIVPSKTFIATSEAVGNLGAKPVFAEIEPETYTLDPKSVEARITQKTKVLMPVHLYGQPASIEPLKAIAQKHNLFLIEDSAQAHGAEYQGKRIGSLGDASGFSFYPGKNLGAFGDAGAITTNNKALSEKIRMLANHGRLTKYEHQAEGVNSRLDTLQAAILDIKLKQLDTWNAQRQHAAARYCEQLASVSDIQLPKTASDRTHVYHLFVLQAPRREALLEALKKEGIHGGIHYPVPLHLQPAYAHLGHKRGEFPVTEQLADNCVSLPIFPGLTDDEVDRVTDAIKKFYGSK